MNRHLLLILTCCIVSVILNGCFEKNDEEIQTRMLVVLNKQRLEGCFCGGDSMPPVQELVYDERLESAARRHVIDMTENDFFNHIGTDGSTPHSRAADADFPGAYVGENIARGFITVEEVMTRWISSVEHCKTIMDPHYSYVGIAYEDYYWVQLFGSD